MIFWIAALVLLSDQLSKTLIRRSFVEQQALVVFPGFFNITYVRNRGGAFGIFPHQQQLFVLLSLATIVAIAYFYKSYSRKHRGFNIGVGMILGGAIGNLLDRIVLDSEGCVTDWIDLYWRGYHWPAFNVADSAICIGVFILLYYLLVRPETGFGKAGAAS